MSKYTRHLGASLILAGVVLLGACGGGEKKSDSTAALGSDTTLNRDLALAGRDTTAQPQLKDVPANAPAASAPASSNSPTSRAPARTTPRRTEPRTTTPRSEPAPTPVTHTTPSGNTETRNAPGTGNGGGAVGTIAAGTTLNTHATSRICTNTNAVGDHVTATLDNSVSGTNGATIPAGATVNLTVTRLKRSENANDPVVMEFAVNSVTYSGHTYPIEANVASADVTRIKDQPQSKDVQKVAVGAAIGAIAGRILGKSTKATVIGGAAGAAAGAATAAATSNYQGCVESGHSIVLKLTAPATVKA